MPVCEKEGLTRVSRSQTHRESITERLVEEPAVIATGMKSHTRLLSAAAGRCLRRRARLVSADWRSVENGEEEKV